MLAASVAHEGQRCHFLRLWEASLFLGGRGVNKLILIWLLFRRGERRHGCSWAATYARQFAVVGHHHRCHLFAVSRGSTCWIVILCLLLILDRIGRFMLTFWVDWRGCPTGTTLIVVNSTILLKHFFDLLIESWESVENVQSFKSWITEASKALMLQSRAQILILLLLLRNNYLLLITLIIISVIIVIILGRCTSYRDRIACRSEDIPLLDLAGTAHDTLLRV